MSDPDRYLTYREFQGFLREFEDFRLSSRAEVERGRKDYEFIRNLLLTVLGVALLGGLINTFVAIGAGG